MKNKILITGGAGFIGSNLCKKLAKDSNNMVVSLDNYSTGSETNHVDNVTYIKGDTLDIFALKVDASLTIFEAYAVLTIETLLLIKNYTT